MTEEEEEEKQERERERQKDDWKEKGKKEEEEKERKIMLLLKKAYLASLGSQDRLWKSSLQFRTWKTYENILK